MADRTLHVSVALSALMIAGALSGCLGPESTAEMARLVGGGKQVAPGATAAFPIAVNVTGNASTTLEVSVDEADGLDVGHPATVEAPANRSTALYVNVTVPDGTGAGDRTVRVELSGDPGRDFVEIPVRVVEPSQRVTRNQTVQIDYVLRHPNGTIIATSIRAIANSSLPKDPIFRPPRQFGAINVSTGSGAPFEGLAEGLVGAGVNSSLSFGIPAWKAPWGNETIEGEQPRQTTVNRTTTFPQNLSRQRRFVQQVNDSSEVGDIVTLGAAEIPFEITYLDNTTVNMTLAMSIGDRATMDLLRDQRGVQNPWPNSSELTEIHNGTAKFYTTPPDNASEPFTFFEAFENASTIVSIDEHEITVEHSPEVGLEYEWSSRRGTQTRTVTEVTETAILYERDNSHPLAGHRTVFDIAVLDAFDTQPPQSP